MIPERYRSELVPRDIDPNSSGAAARETQPVQQVILSLSLPAHKAAYLRFDAPLQNSMY